MQVTWSWALDYSFECKIPISCTPDDVIFVFQIVESTPDEPLQYMMDDDAIEVLVKSMELTGRGIWSILIPKLKKLENLHGFNMHCKDVLTGSELTTLSPLKIPAECDPKTVRKPVGHQMLRQKILFEHWWKPIYNGYASWFILKLQTK